MFLPLIIFVFILLYKENDYSTDNYCDSTNFAPGYFLSKQEKSKAWYKEITQRFYDTHFLDLYTSAHAEDVED